MSQEKVGNVVLDYTFYPGEDLYSDGPVEDMMLEIAKKYGEDEWNRAIAESKSWPALYHFPISGRTFWNGFLLPEKTVFWKLVPAVERLRPVLREKRGG